MCENILCLKISKQKFKKTINKYIKNKKFLLTDNDTFLNISSDNRLNLFSYEDVELWNLKMKEITQKF